MQWKPCENFFAVMLKVFSTFFFILKVGERLTEFGRGSQSLFGFGNILSLRLLLRLLLFNLWFAYLSGGKRGGDQSEGGKTAASDCCDWLCNKHMPACVSVCVFVCIGWAISVKWREGGNTWELPWHIHLINFHYIHKKVYKTFSSAFPDAPKRRPKLPSVPLSLSLCTPFRSPFYFTFILARFIIEMHKFCFRWQNFLNVVAVAVARFIFTIL